MSIRKRRRADGKHAWQVRVEPFAAVTVPSRAAAVRLELELKVKKASGEVWQAKPTTLGAELDAFVDRKEATGGLRARGVEWYEQSAKTWEPFRDRPLSQLRRAEIEDHVATRAARAPVAARNELQVLKACLRAAASRGQRVDQAILEIPAVQHDAREGRAVTAEQLYELASWLPEYVSRLVPLAGFVGARQRVWFELTDDLLSLDDGTMRVPAQLSKNRRPQTVALTPVEVQLFREQLMARAPGTPLVFPTKTGRKWSRHHFRDRVWTDAVKAAGLDGFTFHGLRHTAASLMAAAGMDPAAAAQRLGHSDGGALFLRRYRHLYAGEARRQAERLAAFQVEARETVEGAVAR